MINQAIQDAWCLAEQLAELRSGAVAPGAGREVRAKRGHVMKHKDAGLEVRAKRGRGM